jgi:hypothetical protein
VKALVLLFSLGVWSLPVRAEVARDYIVFITSETKAADRLHERFKKKDPSLCPSSSSSECFQNFVKTYTPRSSTGVVLLEVLSVNEATRAKKKGMAPENFLRLLKNIRALLERVDVRRFYLNEYEAAVTPEETLVLEKLKRDDEELLHKFQVKTKKLIGEKMPEFLRQASSKQKFQLKEEEKRLQALLEQKWVYPSSPAFHEDVSEDSPFSLDASSSSSKSMDITAFCESEDVKNCFKYEFSQCFQEALKLQKSCQSQGKKEEALKKCVLGTFVRQAAVGGKMSSEETCKAKFPPEF